MAEPNSIGRRNGVIGFLKRRFLLILACTVLCGAAATFFVSSETKTYSADAYFLVQSSPSAEGAGQNAYDAQRLAATYSVVLTEDRSLHDAIASRAAISSSSVANSLRATVVNNSSVVRVTWSSQSQTAVAAFFPTLAEVLSSNPSVTPALPNNALNAINLPDEAIAQNNAGTLAVPLAIVLGLVLGFAGAVLLERAAPRIDAPEDATTLLGLPAVDINKLSRGGVSAVVSEMQRDAGAYPLRVAVVGLPTVAADIIGHVSTRLEGASGLPVNAASPNIATVHALPGGRLDGSGDAERITQTTDVTVLVFEFGCRASEIVSATERLSQFNQAPNWLLGVSGRRALAKLAKSEVISPTIDLDKTASHPVSV